MASRHRDFKIKAWPIVSHTSNDQRAETDVLWPLIRYERNGTKSKFSIRPFLFKFERDSASHEFSIMFLFYSIFYKVAFDTTVTLLLLPLLTFHRKSKEYQLTVILSGLLYFLHESFVKKAKTLAFLPLMYFLKEQQIGTPDAVTFQTFLFPFFWRFKSKVTKVMLVLPLYFFFENDKFYINQMWPFLGTQRRPGRYVEYSILYPLFRVRKGANTFTLHLPWPFLKLQIAPEKISFRMLPVCWIRVLRKGGSRGFVFFFYWKHVSVNNYTTFEPPKFTFGIWGLLHIKIANGTENKGHHIFWIFMLLFYRKTSSYRYLFLTPLFMHHLTYQETYKVFTRKIFLMPVFYFSDKVDSLSRKESFVTVFLLYWYNCSIYKVSHHIFLPFYWYFHDNSIQNIHDRRVFVFPTLTYGRWLKAKREEDVIQHETVLNCCYLLYWHRCTKDKHFRVWLFLVFYYSDIVGVKTFLLSLILYIRREKDNNRIFILFIYSSFVRKYRYSLKTYPLFMWIKYEKFHKVNDQEERTDYCHVFVCGLFGRFRDVVGRSSFLWIVPLYFSSVNEMYQSSERFGSLLLLPPYFYHSTDQGKVETSFVLPFYIYRSDWKYMYIFPFFFVRMDRTKKSVHLHFIFDVSIDSEKNEYLFKFLYIPKTRYSLVQADCSYVGRKGASSLKRTRFFIFPLFYYQNRALETPDLDDKNRRIEAPLITISLIWLLHSMCLGKIIIDKRELVKSFYLMPLFYIRIDRNNQVVSAQRNGQYLSFSLLYLVDEKFAFFRYSRLITPNTHNSSIFLFLLFFSSVRNWWSGSKDSLVLQNDHTFALFWFYKPEYSLIYLNRQFSTAAFYYFCLYVFPLFWYDVNQQFAPNEDYTEKNLSILWFIYRRVALFNRWISYKTEANSSSNILSSTATTFLFPIYYRSITDAHKVWKFLWLPAYDTTGLCIVNWFVKYDASSTTFVPVQNRKVASERYHFLPIFYRELEYDLSAAANITLNTSTLTVSTNDTSMVITGSPLKKAIRKVNYFCWIFDRRFSWIRVWSYKTSNIQQYGFYIFLLILMSSSARQNTLKRVFCLFWAFTKWFSFFHHCVECSGSPVLSHKPSDYTSTSTRNFTLGLHFYRKDVSNDNLRLKEFYLLWFFHKYASIVAYWNYIYPNASETGTYFFPLYIWKKECFASKRVNSWSLCWFFHKYAAIFHRSTISSDRKPGGTSVGSTMDDFNHQKFITFFVPLFFFTNDNNETRNLAIFWFFIQRIRFIGVWKSSKNLGFFIYPWVFYETVNSDISNYSSLSLIYLVQKYAAIFSYSYYKNTNTNNYRSTLYLVPYFFRTFTKDANDRKNNIYLFWFFYKRIAMAHYWNEKQLSSGSNSESGFYSFPLIRYTNEKCGTNETKFNLSLLYFFHRLLALIHYSNHISGTTLTRKESMFFIFPLYIHLNLDDENFKLTHTKWSVFWLFYYKLALLRFWNIITFLNAPTTTTTSRGEGGQSNTRVRNWKEPILNQDCSFFIFCLYYFTKQIENKLKSEMGHYLLWALYHKLCIIKLSLETESKPAVEADLGEDYNNSFYIFPLVLWRSSKNNSTTERYVALIWIFHRLISLFYFCKSNFGSTTSSILATTTITTNSSFSTSNPTGKDTKITTFLLLLFFYSSDTRVSEKKWSLLWLFARQLSMVRFSRSLKEGRKLLKFLLFPFFKYERWSAHHSRWCLIPFVPIKFSWVANFVVYEKRVKKVGVILDDGKEDKRSRDQNKIVRVLYKVIVWQFVDQVKTLEINPFFASEHDYTDGYKSWDILGGCIGRVNNSPEHGDACRVFCCCFV
ncbi:hypothetical protein C9374_011392 [Naegleria lovaniensis]|uniref:Uncharacterized protein n=1 Tax=Naegleria lovaniensis TaxID=51637 RepID=A0AA88H480_NAELO|nr:uncharacterized protein C9374_011392 [Naegleria lovaniensis]KAG2392667.1 hypothetical protein C9374_011392 [Naegleria lovaniensis]